MESNEDKNYRNDKSAVNENTNVQDHVQIEDQNELKQPQLEWLKENGVCIDKLRGEPSSGAFSKTLIPKGELIAPAPLLVLKREDLVIYESDDKQKALRNVLNFDKIVGQELLLNYYYGHPESPLLLLPYSPIISFINRGKEANAEIRWIETANDWLDLHPLDVLEMNGQLMMEFVALRDILPGEEIVIDFDASGKTPGRFTTRMIVNRSFVARLACLTTFPPKRGGTSELLTN